MRMALPKRSRPKGSGLCGRFQRMITTTADNDSTALSRKTQTLPTLAITTQRDSIFDYEFGDVAIENYQHHPAIRGAVAV